MLKSLVYKLLPKSIKDKVDLRKKIADGQDELEASYHQFLKEGHTQEQAYQHLINMYSLTNGASSTKLHNLMLSKGTGKKEECEYPLSGVLGKQDFAFFCNVNEQLKEKGYLLFNDRLSPNVIQSLQDYALKAETTVPPDYNKPLVYDPSNPVAEVYRFNNETLVNQELVQDLIMDPVFINIAREYLGCEPIFDFATMWWSAKHNDQPSTAAAQLYHFDMDRTKWLKLFFYITDVEDENGPHFYVEGTHRDGSKSPELLKRGYGRVNDQEMDALEGKAKIKKITGKAGSIFVGDTKCWHKGEMVKKGHRLVLEFEYTASLFGANHPRYKMTNYSDRFKEFCEKNPHYSQIFDF